MTARGVLGFTLLTLLAFGSWYLTRSQIPEQVPEVRSDLTFRGYYLKSARILGTDDSGTLLYEIRAEHAEQHDDERIDFQGVRIEYAPDSLVPWSVSADTATIRTDDRRLQLSGHVVAISSTGLDGGDTEIRTDYLELDPNSHVAETDAHVQIRFGARSLTATGMLASLKDNRLKLKADVSGRFAP